MEIYIYNNIFVCPKLEEHDSLGEITGGIDYDVKYSSMTNKSIIGSTWHEDLGELLIEFIDALSQSDKDILDKIVQDNIPSGA